MLIHNNNFLAYYLYIGSNLYFIDFFGYDEGKICLSGNDTFEEALKEGVKIHGEISILELLYL